MKASASHPWRSRWYPYGPEDDHSTRRALGSVEGVEVSGELLIETEDEFYVGYGKVWAWVPKAEASEVECSGVGLAIRMVLPQWLAEGLELV